MAEDDDGFIAQIGRIGSHKGRLSSGRSLISRVTRAANLARGGRSTPRGSAGFTGRRIGRGYIDGVMLKRDGVTREGQPGELYDARSDRADGGDFLARSEGDRHQFRFIVSPEDGADYDDLKSVTRRLMDQMEKDLGARLDWVAVDHFNTGHPHSHILVRGKDEMGKDLVIARDYITHGIRERASDLVSLDLGPRSEHEIAASLRAEVRAERYTGLDRQLSMIRDRSDDDLVRTAGLPASRQSLLTDRLQTLGKMGLAEPVKGGAWRLDEHLEPTLRRLGRRGDIINTLSYDLKRSGQEHLLVDAVLHDQEPRADQPERVAGRLVRRGLWDEAEDRHYVVLEGVDGHTHVIDIGEGSRTPALRDGAIIAVEAAMPAVRQADMTIDQVARANHGVYDVDAHLAFDPSASSSHAQAHVRRLEAVRRATGAIERLESGGFKTPGHYLDIALRYETELAARRPATVQVLSPMPLDKLAGHNGATLLDRELVAARRADLARAGFGAEMASALEARRQWLVKEGLASLDAGGQTRYRRQLIAILTDRELMQTGKELEEKLGRPFGTLRAWERVEGQLRGKVQLASGSFALVERSRDFVLAPWREALEPHIGRRIGGVLREGGGANWEISGRSRGLDIGM